MSPALLPTAVSYLLPHQSFAFTDDTAPSLLLFLISVPISILVSLLFLCFTGLKWVGSRDSRPLALCPSVANLTAV